MYIWKFLVHVLLNPSLKEQHCIGSWNARCMNQGKLDMVKQEIARANIEILEISELKWTGMNKFKSDNHYVYYCGQEFLRRNGVVLIVNRMFWNAVVGYNLKNDRLPYRNAYKCNLFGYVWPSLFTIWPAIPLLGIYPEKTLIEKDTCIPMLTATLFIIDRTWRQPRCLSTDEWRKKLWYIYTMEYYSAIKRNTFQSFLVRRMNLKVKVKVTLLCLTLCNSMHYTVHGILQVRILEWVAFPFSRRSSQPKDGTQVSHIPGGFLTSWVTREAHKKEHISVLVRRMNLESII